MNKETSIIPTGVYLFKKDGELIVVLTSSLWFGLDIIAKNWKKPRSIRISYPLFMKQFEFIGEYW